MKRTCDRHPAPISERGDDEARHTAHVLKAVFSSIIYLVDNDGVLRRISRFLSFGVFFGEVVPQLLLPLEVVLGFYLVGD